MKTILKSLMLVGIVVCSLSVNAQTASELFSIHPDVEKYAKAYELSDEQIKQVAQIYKASMGDNEELNSKMKAHKVGQEENMKSATPAEREKMKATSNGLSEKQRSIEQNRDRRIMGILTPKQSEQFEMDRAKESPQAKMMKEQLSKPAPEKVKAAPKK